MTEDQYRKLKQEVETAKSEAERAQGALTQLTSRLKEEFECDGLKAAKAKLVKLQADAHKAEQDLSAAIADYQQKWKSEV